MVLGVQFVLEELKSLGFSELSMPLHVGGVEFGFEAGAVGTGVSHDLVLLATEATPDKRLVRLTAGLGRALDHLGSRRPVTLIYIGDALSPLSQDQLERNARLLSVRAKETDEARIRQAIAVLMPIELPTRQQNGSEPIGEVKRVLGHDLTAEHLYLIRAAQGGSTAVRNALREYIDDVFKDDAEELSAL